MIKTGEENLPIRPKIKETGESYEVGGLHSYCGNKDKLRTIGILAKKIRNTHSTGDLFSK